MSEGEENKSATFKLRCTPAEKLAWERTAKREGRSLANWIRFVLNRESGDAGGDGPQKPKRKP